MNQIPSIEFSTVIEYLKTYVFNSNKPMLLVILLAVLILAIIDGDYGFNSKVVSFAKTIHDIMISTPMEKIHFAFKGKLNELDKKSFDDFKMRGVVPVARTMTKASRGYDKLVDILTQSRLKIRGRVLSLCCGRGGWEQVYATSPAVESITAVTLGPGMTHEGHEHFRDWNWPGREKVRLLYKDVCHTPPLEHDTLLFDGGESKTDPREESRKFLSLLKGALDHQISKETKDFVIKILVPTDPQVLDWCYNVQKMTGKGDFYRCRHSRTPTLELYFVSTQPTNLYKRVRLLLADTYSRAEKFGALPLEYNAGPIVERQPVSKLIKPLKSPNYTHSVAALGNPVSEDRRRFLHWDSKGLYPYGKTGSAGSAYVELAYTLTEGLSTNLPGLHEWMATDTTPDGFTKVFREKVDKPPKEDHAFVLQMQSAYKGVANYFIKKGFKLRDLTDDELEHALNKQGAAAYSDVLYQDVGDYLKTDWKKDQKRVEKEVMEDRITEGVFNTMGKRERKKTLGKPKGSRMVAYLPIPMRVLEARKFGLLEELTKPHLNRFGVGGLGLHDIGMRLKELWRGQGTSSDIAGFDTKLGLIIITMEADFVDWLSGDSKESKKMRRKIYSIYGHPVILVPKPDAFRRTELLFGRGQRMSGSRPTYAMNTITRIVIAIAQLAYALGIIEWVDMEAFAECMMEGSVFKQKDPKGRLFTFDCSTFTAMISGDDETISSTPEVVEAYANCGPFLEEIGFPRKDLAPNVKSPIATQMSDVEFCSHHYEPVTYYDSETGRVVTRYMPTRSVAEIIGKTRLWLGGSPMGKKAEAWVSAQGNNLLVDYHHLRTVRALGCAFKASTDEKLILIDKGFMYMNRPWMREGEILDVINECLFGSSTYYPVPGFRVRKIGHLGYLQPRRERIYDPDVNDKRRAIWRARLRHTVIHTIKKYETGGNVDFMNNWRQQMTM